MSSAEAALAASSAGVVRAARDGGRAALFEHEVYALLKDAGFDVPKHFFWEGMPRHVPAALEEFLEGMEGDDAVLKVASPQILHKSDVGGLLPSKKDPGAVAAAAKRIWKDVSRRVPNADLAGILVVEKLVPASGTPAAEALLSFKHDPAFGPVLVFGLGGLLTEWYGELARSGPGAAASTVILRPGDVKRGLEDAARTNPALRIFFERNRGQAQAPLALDTVASLLESLSEKLSLSFSPENPFGNPTLEELEVNPVLLTADGRWVAADGKARLSDRRFTPSSRPVAKIAKLLSPKSAAVIGASAHAMNPGRIILRNLKQSEGIAYGHLFAVHANEKAIDGVPCVESVEALPERVDLAVVSVRAPAATDVVETLAGGRAEAVILIPGGFGEAGGVDLEARLRSALAAAHARPDGGPVLVGGNCLGVVSKRQYNTFFLPQYKLPFHDAQGDSLVAVSQSGAYLVSLTSNLDGIVFPRASISYGNQMDLTVADFLEYFAGDPTIRLLVFYVEGFAPRDGERFLRVARRVTTEGRHVILFKAGKTPLSAEATRSHTASLAGDYEVAKALLEGAGVLVAESLDMFEDFTKVYTMLGDRLPAGRRLAVLSNAGFECAAVLDKLHGLTPAVLAPPTRARLRVCLPAIAQGANPIDATPMADTPAFVEAAAALLDDEGVDTLLVSPIPVTPSLDILAPDPFGAHSENLFSKGSLAQELLRLFRATKKPVVVNVDSGRLYDDFVAVLQRGGIPVYRKIDRASRALSALCS